MKLKKVLPFFTFILALLFFSTFPTHAAQNKPLTSKKAYQQFLHKKVGKKKYFQIVNIGNKNAPVLIIGSGKKEAVNGKTYFNNCKVYTFSNRQIKAMKPFKNYGGRFISLKEKNEKYYLCNGGSDFSSLYTITKEKLSLMNISTVTAQKGQIGQVNLFLKRIKKLLKILVI